MPVETYPPVAPLSLNTGIPSASRLRDRPPDGRHLTLLSIVPRPLPRTGPGLVPRFARVQNVTDLGEVGSPCLGPLPDILSQNALQSIFIGRGPPDLTPTSPKT